MTSYTELSLFSFASSVTVLLSTSHQQDIPVYICQKHTIPVSVTVDRLRLSVTVDRLRISVRMKAVAGMSIYVGIQTKLRVAYQFKTAAHYPYSSTVHTPLLSVTAQQGVRRLPSCAKLLCSYNVHSLKIVHPNGEILPNMEIEHNLTLQEAQRGNFTRGCPCQ